MFRSFGVVLVIWYLSSLFAQSFHALDNMLTASFGAIEAASKVSQERLVK